MVWINLFLNYIPNILLSLRNYFKIFKLSFQVETKLEFKKYIMIALSFEVPLLGKLDYLPAMIFPFIKLFSSN